MNPFDGIRAPKIGVLGDFALDVYWYADMTRSELSRETPHHPLPVVRERISLGAAGNVAANLAALCPAELWVCGAAGDDWRGKLLHEKLAEIGARDMTVTEEGRVTNAYCKPMRMGISDVVYEDPRIDFAATRPILPQTEAVILRFLDRAEAELDALCVCDQIACGTVTDKVLCRLSDLRIPVFADSRDRIARFRIARGALKPNGRECALALGRDATDEDEENARRLSRLTGSPVWVTLGERGSVYTDGENVIATPAVRVFGDVDVCGAGDSSLAAFAFAFSAGMPVEGALRVAAAASAVTVRKIGETGTATREEIAACMT